MSLPAQLGFLERAPGEGFQERVVDAPAPPSRAVSVRVRSKIAASEHIPGFVQEALGDALLSLRDREFSSDDVRTAAERNGDVARWLSPAEASVKKLRANCLGGWFQSRAELHRLQCVGSKPSTRKDARGRRLTVWRFPEVHP